MNAIDAAAIYHALVHRYSDAVNRRDWQDFGECFAVDGQWTVGAPLSFGATGRAEIRELVAARIGVVDIVIQTVGTTHVVLAESERIGGRATIQEQGIRDAEYGIDTIGLYSDELVLEDGQWRFAKRDFAVLLVGSNPPVLRNVRNA